MGLVRRDLVSRCEVEWFLSCRESVCKGVPTTSKCYEGLETDTERACGFSLCQETFLGCRGPDINVIRLLWQSHNVIVTVTGRTACALYRVPTSQHCCKLLLWSPSLHIRCEAPSFSDHSTRVSSDMRVLAPLVGE